MIPAEVYLMARERSKPRASGDDPGHILRPNPLPK